MISLLVGIRPFLVLIAGIPCLLYLAALLPLDHFDYSEQAWWLLPIMVCVSLFAGWLIQRRYGVRSETVYLTALVYVTAVTSCYLLIAFVGARRTVDVDHWLKSATLTVPLSFACAGGLCFLLRTAIGRWIERNRLVPEDVLVGFLWISAVAVGLFVVGLLSSDADGFFGSDDTSQIAICAWPAAVALCLGGAKWLRWLKQRRHPRDPARVRVRYAHLPDPILLREVHNPDLTAAAKTAFRSLLHARGLDDGAIAKFRSDPDEHCMPAFATASSPAQALRRRRRWLLTNRCLNVLLIGSALTTLAFVEMGKELMDAPTMATSGGKPNSDWESTPSGSVAEWIEDHLEITGKTQAALCVDASELFFLGLILKCALWSYPARILLLRPFNRKQLSKGLKRFSARNLTYFGHVFTLADRFIKESIFVSLLSTVPRSPGDVIRLTCHPFVKKWRRRVVVQEQDDYLALRARLWSRWLLNTVWRGAFFDKIHKVRTSDQWWRRCVDLLVSTCEVIIVDLSEVRQGTHWELAKIFQDGFQSKCLFIVRGEKTLAAARAVLETYHGTRDVPEIFVYNRRGCLREGTRFQQEVAQCLSQQRPPYTGQSVLSGHAQAALGLLVISLVGLGGSWGAFYGFTKNERLQEWFSTSDIAQAVVGIILVLTTLLITWLPIYSVPLLLAAWRKIGYSGGRLRGKEIVLFLGGFWLAVLLALGGLYVKEFYKARAAQEAQLATEKPADPVPKPDMPEVNDSAQIPPSALEVHLAEYQERRRIAVALVDQYRPFNLSAALDLYVTIPSQRPDRTSQTVKETIAYLYEIGHEEAPNFLLTDTLKIIEEYQGEIITDLHEQILQSDTRSKEAESFVAALAGRAIMIGQQLRKSILAAGGTLDDGVMQRLALYYAMVGDNAHAIETINHLIATQRTALAKAEEGDKNDAKSALANSVLLQAQYELMAGHFARSEGLCHEAADLDPSEKDAVDRTLAHALMFQNRRAEAWKIYGEHGFHSDKPLSLADSSSVTTTTADTDWQELVRMDFRNFQRQGITNPTMTIFAERMGFIPEENPEEPPAHPTPEANR